MNNSIFNVPTLQSYDQNQILVIKVLLLDTFKCLQLLDSQPQAPRGWIFCSKVYSSEGPGSRSLKMRTKGHVLLLNNLPPWFLRCMFLKGTLEARMVPSMDFHSHQGSRHLSPRMSVPKADKLHLLTLQLWTYWGLRPGFPVSSPWLDPPRLLEICNETFPIQWACEAAFLPFILLQHFLVYFLSTHPLLIEGWIWCYEEHGRAGKAGH